MKKQLTRLLVISSFLIVSQACKKYRENTLWFKNPKKLDFICGELTVYKVNGIDSLQLLDKFSTRNVPFPKKNIQCYQTCNSCHNGHSFSFVSGTSGVFSEGSFKYSDNKKKIIISNNPERAVYHKDIFIQSGLEWDIVYLSKNNSKRKIETTFNGNKYEIQFN